jgi:hypothetical protein
MKTTANKTVKAICGKCNGKGRLDWTTNANGVCFWCDGAGHLLADEVEIAAVRADRAHVIKVIKSALDRMTKSEKEYGSAFTFSDDTMMVAWGMAHADADVRTRAIAALERMGATEVIMRNIYRDEADERAKLVAKVRKVVSNVRKAG